MKNQTKKVLQKTGVILAMVMLFTMLAVPAWADETGSVSYTHLAVCAGPRRAGAESGDACRSARGIGKFGRLIRTHRKISAASHSRRRAFI